MKLAVAVVVVALMISMHAGAEDLTQIFKRVSEYAAKKQYSKALNELEWARKELEKHNIAHLEEFLPKDLVGYQGDEIQKNSALGITSISRRYRKEGQEVQISLTGGSSSGTNQALGGLVALGKMAAMMDGNNQDTFRIHGRTATLSKVPGLTRSELSVFLDSGSILKLESADTGASETLKTMAEAIKIEELDSYMKD